MPALPSIGFDVDALIEDLVLDAELPSSEITLYVASCNVEARSGSVVVHSTELCTEILSDKVSFRFEIEGFREIHARDLEALRSELAKNPARAIKAYRFYANAPLGVEPVASAYEEAVRGGLAGRDDDFDPHWP